MVNEVQTAFAAEDIARLKEVIGEPLFLSAEDAKAYDEMLVDLLQCYKPQDFVERLFVAEIAVEIWAMRGHRRHGDLAIKRMLRQLRQFDVQRKKLAAQGKEARERAAAEKTAKPETELERVCELEDVCDRSIDDMRMLDRPPVELEYEKEIAPPEDRDELDALCAALPDLMRLARYERRAWSGRKRAFLEFMEAKLIGGRYESGSVGREEAKHGRSQ